MGQVYDVKVLNQYAYCITEVGFFRINVEDPYNIFVKNKVALPTGLTTFSKLVLDNGYAYIGNGSAGVTIVDISNPDVLSIASTVSSTAIITEVAVKDSALYALALDGDMIKIISVANPYKPYIANTIYATQNYYSRVYGLAIIGNYLFCGGQN